MIALAALAAIVFAPPTDHALRFRTEQTVPKAAGQFHYSMVEEVRFTRAPAGWRMSVTTISSGTDAPRAAAGAFDLMMAAFAGVATTYTLSAAGRPVGVVDPDRVWGRTIAALDRALALRFRSLGPAARAPLRAFRDAYAATPPAGRRAALLDNAAALLAPPRLPDPGRPIAFRDMASDAAGRPAPVAGAIRRIAAPAGSLGFRIDATTAAARPADRVRETRAFTISARDGLLLGSHRQVIAGDGPALVDETITRLH